VTVQTPVSPLAAGTAPGLVPAAQADTRAVRLNEVSWGAIFAGVVTALVTQVIVNLVGVGVGLAAAGGTAGTAPDAATASLGAGLWFVASGLIAALAGGLIAGRLSGKPLPGAAGLHGLVSWAVTTLVVLYLLTSAASGLVGGTLSTVSGALGGAGNLVGGTVQTVAQTAAQAAAPTLSKVANPLEGLEQTVRQQAAGQDPQAAREAAVAAIKALVTGEPGQKQQAEARAADALAKAQNIPADQARQQVQDYERQYTQAVTAARQKAEAAAATAKAAATQGAFYAALALVLGALAAFLGGRLGAPRPAPDALRRA
jgi:hypothetical protein